MTIPGKLREIRDLAVNGLAAMESSPDSRHAARAAWDTFQRLAMELSSVGPAMEELQRAVEQDTLLKGPDALGD